MRTIKRLLLVLIVLLATLGIGYAAEVTLGWDYDHTVEGNENVKFRIYGKKTSESEYTSASWDSTTESDPQVHTATLTVEDGEDYNFIARAYVEGTDENGENIIVESENSNEVTFNAPEFIISGVSVTTFVDSEKYEHPVYFGTTDKDITISWDSLSGATYEYRLWDINRETYALTGTSEEASATFKLPKTGCYEFEVRAKRDSDYTEWVKIDSRIVGWVAGVGPIVIGGN